MNFIGKIYYSLLILFFVCIFSLQAQQNDGSRYASNSVLAQGKWYKMKIPATGVYKLTYEKLRQIGLSDPKNVQVYGYGGWELDKDFTKPYVDDLPQVAIWMSKPRESFGPGDYVLFYAKGTIKWTYDSRKDEFIHSQNPYSTESYYFLTESSDGPKLMADIPFIKPRELVVTTYTDYYLHEKEMVNPGSTGRHFYGESFKSKTSQTFDGINLTGITSDQAKITMNFIAHASSSGARVALSVNGGMDIIDTPVSSSSNIYTIAKETNDTKTTDQLKDNNSITIKYTPASSGDKNVHLGYFRINYTRKLQPYGGVTMFRSREFVPDLGFSIANASEKVLIFDVTEGETPKRIQTNISGSTLTFAASNTSICEYAMVDLTKSIPEPEAFSQVVNQNLHALNVEEMIIIVRPALKRYAEQLARMHAENPKDGIKSLIVTAEDIYNEFSSGKPDITAYRRFLKMFYDRAQDNSQKPKYVLLFGDGSFDNRFLLSVWSENDKRTQLLIYQSEESLSETSSYSVEDYIGFLDDDEGATDSAMESSLLDISIGRLPVRNETEVAEVLNKIQQYMDDKDKGIWKNNVAFLADDLISGQGVEKEDTHFLQSDAHAERIQKDYPSFIVNKIYMDAYERVITANGGRYPEVTKILEDKFNSGLLFLNFMGHGSTTSWTHEQTFINSDILALRNTRYPLVITATCDFGFFDAYERAGGELFLLNSHGGAIALFTTTRVVYSSGNNRLCEKIFDHIFEKENRKPARIGDILRHAKVSLGSDDNKLKFVLLGDPALRLAYPDNTYQVNISEVNSKDASGDDIWLKALSEVEIKGEIIDNEGFIINNFNGILESTVFDSKQELQTRGNQRDGTPNTGLQRSYFDYTNKIYNGKTPISNGEFILKFTVPKDILYEDDYGKMSFYAYDDQNGFEAQGSYQNYIVGKMDEGAQEENNPPVIDKIYLNKEDFQQGSAVNKTPLFYAHVSDDTGINISGGIGHNISITIDGTTTYNLNDEFVQDADSYKAGSVTYSFRKTPLDVGKHSLEFKVWDVWNNSAIDTLHFEVVENYKPHIYDFVIKGNPAKDETTLSVISDMAGSNVNVRFHVYSLTGALYWTHEEAGTVDMMNNYDYKWNLMANSGNKLQPGIYICRMELSVDGGAKATKSRKLIVVGQ